MSDTITVTILRRVGQHQRGERVTYDRASAEFLIARDMAELVEDERPARKPTGKPKAPKPPTVVDEPLPLGDDPPEG
ncbi:hypothetical protein AB0M43_33595 [Longispora sp. NPDC051575]|uniref:hypothetical protein n=1 Tax=Longispora sp. NPDC051575 TaxID=3154943 RepID=UPI00342ADE51